MVPCVASPPATPFTLQLTVLSAGPKTMVTENGRDAPVATVAVDGDTLMDMKKNPPPPPQAARDRDKIRSVNNAKNFGILIGLFALVRIISAPLLLPFFPSRWQRCNWR